MTTATANKANGKTTETKQRVLIKPIQVERCSFGIKGTSPYIQHHWSQKALEMLRMTAAERKKIVKTKRDPEGEAEGAMYFTADGNLGIPAMAFKSSLIAAAHKDLGLEKTLLRKALFVICPDSKKVIPFSSHSEPVIREDVVRVGQGQTDLRYRPEFTEWNVEIQCEIDAQLLTLDDVVNLVNRAGFGVGIGEWRPERGGEYGRFTIDDLAGVKSA